LAAEGDGRWTEYAGGYSDMMAQRQSDLPARPAASGTGSGTALRSAPPPKAEGAVSARKMSFKDRHALEKLPAQMAALQAEAARLRQVMADPDLYAKDAKRFSSASAALAKAEAALVEAEERWLELEMQRESLAG
jgi:ATP-binding cassette subfamily F protein uup